MGILLLFLFLGTGRLVPTKETAFPQRKKYFPTERCVPPQKTVFPYRNMCLPIGRYVSPQEDGFCHKKLCFPHRKMCFLTQRYILSTGRCVPLHRKIRFPQEISPRFTHRKVHFPQRKKGSPRGRCVCPQEDDFFARRGISPIGRCLSATAIYIPPTERYFSHRKVHFPKER